MIRQITQRLSEVNTLLTTCKPEDFSFGQALTLSLFYRDFSDTNSIVNEAENLVQENPVQLWELSSSLISESDRYLSLDRSALQAVDFKTVFEEYLKPSELRYEEAKAIATGLWNEYSAMSNRLDFLPLDSEEYKSLDAVCDMAKTKYDEIHARANMLYNEWQQKRDRYFCVYCFKPMFLDVLVGRLKGIAVSIITDIKRVKEDKP